MTHKIQPLVPVSREGLEEIARSLLEEKFSQDAEKPKINPNINPRDYVQVGINGLYGTPVLISKFEIPNANNMNYEDTHKFVLKQGLYVPTPNIFMAHFCNVVKAYNQKAGILDGNGNSVTGKELKDIYSHLTTNHIAIYGKDPGAWTWLNAKFIKGRGFKSSNLEIIIGIDTAGNLKVNSVPLEQCEWSDSFVDLDFNSQGLAKRQSSSQNYAQGNNIRFYFPRKNQVARLYAGSDRANLYCYRGPGDVDASLGVFACAEGTQKI